MAKKRIITLDVEVCCYSPSQSIDDAISIGELKEILDEYDEDDKIMLRFSNGYSFGNISEDDFRERFYEMDEE